MLIKPESPAMGVTVEMTPMIDIVFLLLIFFLVATTFHQSEREMKIALPFAASAGPISTMLRELIINVDDAGKIILSGQVIEADRLRVIVSEAVKANPEQKVTVRGDRHVAYGAIASVLDICKSAGIQEPYLDTVPTK